MRLKSAPTGMKGRLEHGNISNASTRSLKLGWPWGAKSRVRSSSSRPVAVKFLRGNQQAPDVTLMLNTSALLRFDTKGSDVGELLTFRAPTPLSGFSQATLSEATMKARKKVLDILLGNLRSQRPDANLGSMVVELVLQGRGIADVAATLMLLLECGQQEEQVVAAGSAFLQTSAAISAKAHQEALPDVALCVALAHRHLALVALGGEESVAGASPPATGKTGLHGPNGAGEGAAGPALAVAYGHVSSALKLIKEWWGKAADASASGAADPLTGHQHLQSQLLAMMRSIAPQYTLHLLEAGPHGKPSRERAMDVLKLSLWQVEGVEGVEHRLELMAQVRSALSASEQIALYENAVAPDAELAEQELYDLALAHIWEGYNKRWPHHVYRADALLRAISKRTDLGLDVRLERKVCALLLGSASGRRAGGVVPELGAEAAGRPRGAAALVAGTAMLSPEVEGPELKGAARAEPAEGQLGGPDSAVMVVSSVDGQDEQLAMEDWAQHWLELAIMPGFTQAGSAALGSATVPPAAVSSSSAATTVLVGDVAALKGLSVRSYLSSPKVVLFNQVLHYANERRIWSVTENLQHLSHDALQQLMSLWRSSASTLAHAQRLLPQRQPAQDKQQQLVQEDQEQEQEQKLKEDSHASFLADAGSAQESRAAALGQEGAFLSATLSAVAVLPGVASAAPAALDGSGSLERLTVGAVAADVDLTDRLPSFDWLDGPAAGVNDFDFDNLVDEYDALDGMAAAAPHAAQALTMDASIQQAVAYRARLVSNKAFDSSSSSGVVVQDVRQHLTDSSSSLWVQSGSGIRPRATARIVNPSRPGQLSARDAMHLPDIEGRRDRGGALTDVVLMSAKIVVVMAVAGAAWLAGRGMVGKEVQAAPASLVVQQLRGLQRGAASLLHWGGAATVVSGTLPATTAGIEQGIAKAHRDASCVDLTPRAAAGLLLSWCAATQTPREAKALFPLLLEGGALMQARAKAALRQLSRAERGRGASTAHVEVLSLHADSSRLVTVRSKITISREAAARGRSSSSNNRSSEEVAISFRRAGEGGEPWPLGPWRISQVDVLSRK